MSIIHWGHKMRVSTEKKSRSYIHTYISIILTLIGFEQISFQETIPIIWKPSKYWRNALKKTTEFDTLRLDVLGEGTRGGLLG